MGFYGNGAGGVFGFSRDSLGNITTISPPNAVNSLALAINDSGEITGEYLDHRFVCHAFVRDQNGVYHSFNDPNAVYLTYGQGINNSDQISGVYLDGNVVEHGFVRSAQGQYYALDVPSATGTEVSKIDGAGDVVGDYTDVFGIVRGFLFIATKAE